MPQLQLSNLGHGKTELDAAGFIRAEENDKQTHIKKFAENLLFCKNPAY